MNRRLLVSGAVLIAVLGIAGCDTKTAPASGTAAPVATASPTASPLERLQAAAKRLGEDTSKVKMELGNVMTGSGQIDPKNKKGTFAMSMSAAGQNIDMEMVTNGNDAYLKMGGQLASVLGDKWMHMDATKFEGGKLGMMSQGDAAKAQALVNALTDLKADGPNSFSGTLDMAKSSPLGEDALKTLKGVDTKVPFTATLDDQGRMATMTMDMSGLAKGQQMPEGMTLGKMVVSYSDFGTPVTVKIPAKSETQELPKEMSGLLGA